MRQHWAGAPASKVGISTREIDMTLLSQKWAACIDEALSNLQGQDQQAAWSALLDNKEAVEALAWQRESEPEVFELTLSNIAAAVGSTRARLLRGIVSRRWKILKASTQKAPHDDTPATVDPEIWRQLRIMPRTGKPSATLYNARLILQDHNLQGQIGRPRLNLLDGRVYLQRGSIRRLMNDRDVVDVAVWLDQHYSCEVSSNIAFQILDTAAKEDPYHPVRDYLGQLTWDGTSRLRNFAVTYLGTDPSDPDCDLYQEYCLRWLVSAVARCHAGVDPATGVATTVKADHVLVLAGRQGAGKSTAARILGAAWHADTPIAYGTKDSFQSLRGVWLYELAELAKVRGSELEAVKAFISAERDHYRPSYGRCEIDAPRQCVFLATVNPDGAGFLRDPTGERRWWVVPIGHQVDREALQADRDQLWAEAVALYEAGCQWWLSADLEVRQAEDALKWATADAWADRLHIWISGAGAELRYGVNLAHIAQKALSLDNPTRGESMRLAQLLKAAGLQKSRQQVDGRRQIVWVKP